MALLGATFTLTSHEQFLDELHDLGQIERDASLEGVDYALRSFIAFAAHFYEDFLLEGDHCEQAIAELLHSPLWQLHSQRHCHTLVDLILTKDQKPAIISFSLESLNAFGKRHHFAHRLMRKPYAPAQEHPDRYVDLAVVGYMMQSIQSHGRHQGQETVPARLPWLCSEVLYETCRHTKLAPEDLSLFSDAFVVRLFELVELTRDERDDSFNYTLVKLIIALNEQFMVASLPKPSASSHSTASKVTRTHQKKASSGSGDIEEREEANVVLRTIRDYMGSHKTFGENLIFILNRCSETEEDRCVSLLILKILYLLFTSPGTNEYFYTNDLCVLVDVFIRELHDLAEDSEGLRHTFLRVLHPLLTNTQLRIVPYKRAELRRQLREMVTESYRSKINATTKRLVERNLQAPWSQELEAIDMVSSPLSPPSPTISVHSAVAAASPDPLEQSLPDLRASSADKGRIHHKSSKSESAASRSEEAVLAIENIKLNRHFTRDEDEISRRGSTMSTNSLASQHSVAVAASSPPCAPRPWESDDQLSPVGISIPRPASAGSSHSQTQLKKRKPPPIPGFRRRQHKETSLKEPPSGASAQSFTPLPPRSADSSSSNGIFDRELVQSKGAKRAPPPVPTTSSRARQKP